MIGQCYLEAGLVIGQCYLEAGLVIGQCYLEAGLVTAGLNADLGNGICAQARLMNIYISIYIWGGDRNPCLKVFPRSSDPFHMVSYYIKSVTTARTHGNLLV